MLFLQHHDYLIAIRAPQWRRSRRERKPLETFAIIFKSSRVEICVSFFVLFY